MRNIVFLNLIQNNTNSQIPLINGKTLSAMVQDFISILPDVEKIIPIALDIEQVKMFYQGQEPDETVLLRENRQDLLLKTMKEASADFDNCFYFFADTPLLDSDLFKIQYDRHLKYYADYSFADGYPEGLSVEIINPYTLTELSKLMQGCSEIIDRDSLFSWIQKDINSFDIETVISEKDLRLKRLRLACDSKINLLQLESFMDSGIVRASDFMKRSDELEAHCRTAPAYYQIQIASACPQSCSYCPYPSFNPLLLKDERQMKAESVLGLCSAIESYTPDAVVSLSLWGEVSLYKGIIPLLGTLLEKTSLSYVIETSGIGWKGLEEHKAMELIGSPRIEWIFSLDAVNPNVYSLLRGDGRAEAIETAENFMKLNPSHTWVQAVRMRENEEDLELFYRHWKEKTENVIVQKYDHFSHRLPQKKITDLSPLERFPCWHLKREMAILMDGTVCLCREDYKGETVLGNCFNESLEELWEKGRSRFLEQVDGLYCGICENCDEFYSFNF